MLTWETNLFYEHSFWLQSLLQNGYNLLLFYTMEMFRDRGG